MKVMEKKAMPMPEDLEREWNEVRGLLSPASVQESQNCDEADAGRFCEAVYRGQKGG